MKINRRQMMDGRKLLAAIDAATVPMVFFDPQYRGLLDRQGYGNEGEGRQIRRVKLPQMSERIIKEFITLIGRALRPSGHLVLWSDKYSVLTATHLNWVQHCSELFNVDAICWGKNQIGMGARTRCKSEYAVIMQKRPIRARGIWTDHSIPDFWPEAVTRRGEHPHAKPHKLQCRLIEAVTSGGDLVVDPAAGSYSVMKAAQACGRNFLGCDLMGRGA